MGTYVISDIHGRLDLFVRMLEKIQFSENDRLYVLGDVADRGPDGVDLYLMLMMMDNVTFLLGNHDLMFIRAARKAAQMCYSPKALKSEEFGLWIMNGGSSTWNKYIRLPKATRTAILHYIREAYLVIPSLAVGGHYFYLCHATHAERPVLSPLRWKDSSKEEVEHVVWERQYPDSEGRIFSYKRDYRELYNSYPRKTTMIFGHTPTISFKKPGNDERGRIWRGGKGHLIDIDCGCAVYDEKGAMLGCLRLDDMREFYVHY
ncbi:MAG: fructose-bisphosphatase class III [Lachnospiraceae bacterium]|nr:fructose-bisphosphatase class III [Lachnospiraceae bacterium]